MNSKALLFLICLMSTLFLSGCTTPTYLIQNNRIYDVNSLQGDLDMNHYNIYNLDDLNGEALVKGNNTGSVHFNYGPYAITPNDAQAPASKITMLGWWKFDGTLAEDYHILINTTNFNDWQWIVIPSGEIQIYSPHIAGGAATTSDAGLVVGRWYMLALTWDGATIKMFKGDATAGTLTQLTLDQNAMVGDIAPGDWWIGRRNDNSHPFRGWIDEVAIFDRNLSGIGGDITTLWNGGNGTFGNIANAPFNSGLWAGYHYDDWVGVVADDFSGGSRDATIYNSFNWDVGKVINPVALPDSNESISLIMTEDVLAPGVYGRQTHGDSESYLDLNGKEIRFNVDDVLYGIISGTTLDLQGNNIGDVLIQDSGLIDSLNPNTREAISSTSATTINWDDVASIGYLIDFSNQIAVMPIMYDSTYGNYLDLPNTVFLNANGYNVDLGNGTLNIPNADINNIDIKNDNITGAIDINGTNLNLTGNLKVDGNMSIKRPYGMYSSMQTQTVGATGTAYIMDFNITEDSYLITRQGDTDTNIVFNVQGDYEIILSIMAQTGGAASDFVEVWVRKNGTNVVRSNTRYTFKGVGTNAVIAVPFILDFDVGDKLQVMYAGSNTGITLPVYGASAYAPAVPSAIMTIAKISELT